MWPLLSDRLLLVNQTFTKLDMVYSDFLWSPPDMVLVLILDSQKYGHHQIYLYTPAVMTLYLNTLGPSLSPWGTWACYTSGFLVAAKSPLKSNLNGNFHTLSPILATQAHKVHYER